MRSGTVGVQKPMRSQKITKKIKKAVKKLLDTAKKPPEVKKPKKSDSEKVVIVRSLRSNTSQANVMNKPAANRLRRLK